MTKGNPPFDYTRRTGVEGITGPRDSTSHTAWRTAGGGEANRGIMMIMKDKPSIISAFLNFHKDTQNFTF
jgi:hypothetical protein